MIEVEHLHKVYGSTIAIEDIAFQVEKGEILGFLGPNGAGKTTTMRILSGAISATKGTARVAGFDVHEQPLAVKKRIGYLPEIPPLYPSMTVAGFLNFVARIKGISAGDRPLRLKQVIERCDLQAYRNTLIYKLSKGYRQRVGIAQALIHKPPVIILDEPTVGLDPLQIIAVRDLIRSLAGEHTILLSTHILPEVSMTCDRVTIINQGKVVTNNSLDNLSLELSSSFSYDLEVAGVTISTLDNLGEIAGVSQVNIKSQMDDQRWRLEILCQGNYEPGKEIAQMIVNQGGSLYEMRRHRASLEDVFLQLTTTEDR